MNVVVFLLLLLLVRSTSVDACPQIYKTVDDNHSFCLPKRSIESRVPTSDEIELIVRMHNEERSRVRSSDMQKMFWNDDIAEIAQRYAEHCKFSHDEFYQRQAPRIPVFTGQNLAMGYDTWTQAITAWANEKKDFVYGQTNLNVVVGHYTQMVKSTAALVGCGFAICPKDTYQPASGDWPNYVCNYVTGQSSGNKPYEPGSGRLHDCGGMVCLYNGQIDIKSCKCECPTYATGKYCENLDCSLAPDNCGYTNPSECKQYSNVAPECPKMCGGCDVFSVVKDHYGSHLFLSSGTTRSTLFISFVFQCSTIVLCQILFQKE